MAYSLDAPLPGAVWEVRYLVDMTAQRHVIELGSTPTADLAAGPHPFDFRVEAIDLEGVKSSWLNNVGLLTATLKDSSGEEVFQISMVTQISKVGDAFHRTVLSPLE